jgi:quinoprotein glucose dehydrogenase
MSWFRDATLGLALAGLGALAASPAGAAEPAGQPRSLAAQTAAMRRTGEWPYYGGNKGFQRYSPLAEINAGNIGRLTILWTRPGVDPSLTQRFPDLSPSHYYNATPVFVGGTLYTPDAVGLIEAVDPETGGTKWVQQPFGAGMQEAAGRSMRGLDTWRGPGGLRLLLVRGSYLYAVNAKDGTLYPGFGDHGRVDLLVKGPYAKRFTWSSGPIVVRDVVVVGGTSAANGAGDGGFNKESSPDDVRGYDVRTGKLLWTFHVVPHKGEPGYDTWADHAADYAGNLSAWCPLSADEELGLVYLPFTAPTAAYYGGWRAGDNLYSDSLVAADVRTGKRRWHFQMVHHDLWEYDNVGPPVLGDITVDGRRIKAVMQANKNAFVFVLDRATGRPVWPIEERAVPASTVPGEHASATQPFPTAPPPLDLQDLNESQLNDLTPGLHSAAEAAVHPFLLGPMYTPPIQRSDVPGGRRGTLLAPGDWGSANWNTGSFDPETSMYYGVTMTLPEVFQLVKATDPKATMEYWEPEGSGADAYDEIDMPEGMPYTRPPYGRMTALDMHHGTRAWVVADGDGVRNSPLLKDLHLPMLGVRSRPAPLITRTLLFLGEGSDAIIGSGPSPYDWGRKFRAYDKGTGKVLWATELPSGTTGGPMSFRYHGRQYIVVAVGSKKDAPELVALGLPWAQESGACPRPRHCSGVTSVGTSELTVRDGVYSAAQAAAGRALYPAQCSLCHRDSLAGGVNESPPLTGRRFLSGWQGMPLRALYRRILSTMPKADPGTLSEEQTLSLVAYLLQTNGYPPGSHAMASPDALNGIRFAYPP